MLRKKKMHNYASSKTWQNNASHCTAMWSDLHNDWRGLHNDWRVGEGIVTDIKPASHSGCGQVRCYSGQAVQ